MKAFAVLLASTLLAGCNANVVEPVGKYQLIPVGNDYFIMLDTVTSKTFKCYVGDKDLHCSTSSN